MIDGGTNCATLASSGGAVEGRKPSEASLVIMLVCIAGPAEGTAGIEVGVTAAAGATAGTAAEATSDAGAAAGSWAACTALLSAELAELSEGSVPGPAAGRGGGPAGFAGSGGGAALSFAANSSVAGAASAGGGAADGSVPPLRASALYCALLRSDASDAVTSFCSSAVDGV